MTLDPYVVIILCALPFFVWSLTYMILTKAPPGGVESAPEVLAGLALFLSGCTIIACVGAGFAVGVGLVGP